MVEQFAESQVVKVALLIDGDNAQPSLIGSIITETAKYGSITIPRGWGAWGVAPRIREHGVFVMGIGKKSTPKAFVNACNIFIQTENLAPRQQAPRSRRDAKVPDIKSEKPKEPDPLPLLKGAYEMAVQVDGWANLGTLGFYLHQLDPSFNPRSYGFKQLSQLVKNHSHSFELH